jgi:DNA-binding XRE family transcriptional regulator
MTINFKEDLERRLKDPEFKKEYDDLKIEFIIIQTIIDARRKYNITQKELSKRTGITQADISRLENGNGNPTIKLLQKLANGLDMDLELRFVPKTK